MKKIAYIYVITFLVLGTSCKSIKNLAARDDSRREKKQPANQSGELVFLDNVSVTPGSAKTATAESGKTSKKYQPYSKSGYFNIENANPVQFKYATITDAPVEELTNIQLLQTLDYWWGTKYCLGGSSEACIDCSAFTQNILCNVYNVQIPRTAQQQFDSTIRLEPNEIREGDLVFFQTSGRSISHVGIYIINNKFAHASVSNGVIISDLNENYWRTRYRGAGRVNAAQLQ